MPPNAKPVLICHMVGMGDEAAALKKPLPHSGWQMVARSREKTDSSKDARTMGIS
jgi:hypothetical protein